VVLSDLNSVQPVSLKEDHNGFTNMLDFSGNVLYAHGAVWFNGLFLLLHDVQERGSWKRW
jgi:hypothetical protein